ncbi:MAG: hypothetical protein CMM18_03545 [Rhodospirillaceae bacterium]|nr:hypothetical protein [Rhodospirillaceae bacterium]|tara:strand:+ start:165 stop:914 length:750 start_codon:yes stop_codon:yes gene_type:complete
MINKKLLLPSISNFRDLGGYCNKDHLKIKKNNIYRSNFFSNISKEDLIKLKNLNIKTIIDFRGTKESEVNTHEKYSKLGINMYSKPIETNSSIKLYNLFTSGKPSENKVKKLMIESYKEYALDFSENYKFFFEVLSNKDSFPLIFHCTAGKDRTGFAAALLLYCLGMSNENIQKDYLFTNKVWKPNLELPKKASKAAIKAMLRADVEYINSALDAARNAFGNLDLYLTKALKLSDTKKNKIFLNLMEKP